MKLKAIANVWSSPTWKTRIQQHLRQCSCNTAISVILSVSGRKLTQKAYLVRVTPPLCGITCGSPAQSELEPYHHQAKFIFLQVIKPWIKFHLQLPIPADHSDPVLTLTCQCRSLENLLCLPNYTRTAVKQQKWEKYSLWQVFSSNLLKMYKKKALKFII